MARAGSWDRRGTSAPAQRNLVRVCSSVSRFASKSIPRLGQTPWFRGIVGDTKGVSDLGRGLGCGDRSTVRGTCSSSFWKSNQSHSGMAKDPVTR